MARMWAALRAFMVAVLLASAAHAQEPQLIRMGTGNVAGAYFPVGVALCRLVNQHRRDTGLRCAARPTGGSVANMGELRDGSVEFAIVQSDTQAEAWAGTGGFAAAGPFAALRSVMALHSEPLTIVARADADVRGVEDLAGKRVALGAPGSGSRAIADDLLATLGWTPASFAATPDLEPDRLARTLCAGEIDAFFYAVGHPALVVQEATTACDAVLIDAAGPAIDELIAARPSFVAATIPGGLYRGTARPVATFGVEATLVTTADVPDDTVYTLVRTVFEDFDMLRGLEPVLVGLEPRNMVRDGLAAPVHSGALRYYRERGWIE